MPLIRALLVLTWIFAGTQVLAETRTVVESPAGLSFTLQQDPDGGFSVRIPLAPAEPAVAVAGIELDGQADVVFRDGRGTGLAKLFDRAVVGESTSAPILQVSAPGSLQPGVYTLVLLLRRKGDAKSGPQSLTLTLRRPAAVLTAAGTLVIGQERPWVGADVSQGGTLKLTESSAIARATALRFLDSHEIREGQVPDQAKLKVSGSDSIPAGQSRMFAVNADGAFALGKTTGKLEVSTPDMTSPLVINYEVKAYRPKWLIAAIAALGGALGFSLRVVIVRRQTMIDARIRVNLAIASLEQRREFSDDETFQKSLKDLEIELQTAVTQRDFKKVEELTKALPERIDVATRKLESDMAPVGADYAAMTKLLSTSWLMPTRFRASFTAVADALYEVKALLDRHNPSIARSRVDAAMTMLTQSAHELQSYGQRVMTSLSWIRTHLPPLRSADAKRTDDSIDLVLADLRKLGEVERDADCSYARAVLSRTDRTYEGQSAALRGLGSQSKDFAAWARTTLGISSSDILATGTPGASGSDYASRLVQLVEDGEDAATALGAAYEALVADWKAMLLRVRPEVNEQQLSAQLESGNWQGAVESTASTPSSAVLGTPSPSPALEIKTSLSTHQTEMTVPARQGFRLPSDSVRVKGSLAELEALERANFWLVALQSLFFYVLFIAVAYASYEQAWVGDIKEILALFLFAFGVDLTSDSVIAAFTKPKAVM